MLEFLDKLNTVGICLKNRCNNYAYIYDRLLYVKTLKWLFQLIAAMVIFIYRNKTHLHLHDIEALFWRKQRGSLQNNEDIDF